MSEVLPALNNELPADDIIKSDNAQQQQNFVKSPVSTSESLHVQVCPEKQCNSSLEANVLISATTNDIHQHLGISNTATVLSSAAQVFLPSVPTATHPNNGSYPNMITTDNMYNLPTAPVFMTPSIYPQVAVIPEGDLLRSMIAQDVKQVTDKLLEKQGKKKKGRRNRKERVMHGDFGTLKVNFRKFFQEQPPMTVPESVPKRTVYQRIAPRYSVSCTDTTSALPSNFIPECNNPKPDIRNSSNKKKSCSSGTKKQPEVKSDKNEADCKTQRRAYKSSKIKRTLSSVKAKDVQFSSGSNLVVPQSNQTLDDQITCPDSGIIFTNSEQNDTDTSSVQNVFTTLSDPSDLDLLSINDYVQSITGFQNGTDSVNNADVSFDINSGICNGLNASTNTDLEKNCAEVSSNDILNGFTESLTNLVPSSSQSHFGDVDRDGFGSGPGEITNEFSFLSELYNDFQTLCSDDIFNKMDIALATEGLCQNNEAGSALSSLQVSKPNNEDKSQSVTPVSSHQTTANTSTSTEVVNDSSWVCTFDNNTLSNATECLQSSQDAIEANNNSIDMDVDVCESHVHGESCGTCDSCNACTSLDTAGSHGLVDIIDISPEYASTEGGGKIILIGSWNNKAARYSCQFGDVSVSADLIQNGVLRCYCPAYKPGKVKVAVLCDDSLLSKQVDFEYVDTEEGEKSMENHNHDWLTIKDDDLNKLLIQRIEALCGIFDSQNNISHLHGQTLTTLGSELEDGLTKICESLSAIRSTININRYDEDKVMTILHLSAALGFTKLIQLLCNWIETNSNSIIAQEANPRRKDQFQLTPLMWACAKGKFDTVCVLLQWDESTVQQTDGCGCTPLSISRSQGHTILERYLQRSQSKGHTSKLSSLLSENGSPLLQIRGRLSRSSSLNSQLEHSRESFSGIDDNSPDSTNGFPSRTLGQTLAYVQAIIQDGVGVDVDDGNSRNTSLTNIDVDDESLFVPSPFTPRTQNNSCDDIRYSAQTPRSSLSSLSPGSPGHNSSVQSPFDPSVKDTAEFCEFFYNSERILEKDFAELTLTDEEQQNLYKAATVIQNAYKGYRVRRKQRDSELSAAVLIQSYYRRYKQYATFKKMQKGAMVIQHKYRAHREKEKQKSHAASVIQTYYRRYKERKESPGAESFDAQQKSKVIQLADRKASRFRTQTNNRNRDSTGDPAV